MNTRIKTAAISLASVAVLVALTGCGPSQQEQDKTAATDVAQKFTKASLHDKCLYDARYTTKDAIDRCQSGWNTADTKEGDGRDLSVQDAQVWGDGFAVKLKHLDADTTVFVVGLVKIGDAWKVSKEDTTSEAVGAQSDWACQVIGGPDCGGSK